MGNQKNLTKEQRQELLDEFMQKEITRLKRICYKYKHRPLFYNQAIIREEIMDGEDKNTLGTWTREDIKNQYKFTHIITLNKSLLDNYLNIPYMKWLWKERLRHVIRHELIHGLCYEEFEEWQSTTEVTHTHGDGSPIFLTCLHFLDGDTSGHNVGNKFRKSKIYQQIKDFKTWDEVRCYCINLMFAYNKATRNIGNKYNKQEYLDPKHVRMISNNFSFSSRGFGLVGRSCNKTKAINMQDKRKLTNIFSFWEIGAYILPEELEQLFEKKISNYSFCKLEENKYLAKKDYMLDVKTKQKIKYDRPAS